MFELNNWIFNIFIQNLNKNCMKNCCFILGWSGIIALIKNCCALIVKVFDKLKYYQLIILIFI